MSVSLKANPLYGPSVSPTIRRKLSRLPADSNAEMPYGRVVTRLRACHCPHQPVGANRTPDRGNGNSRDACVASPTGPTTWEFAVSTTFATWLTTDLLAFFVRKNSFVRERSKAGRSDAPRLEVAQE